MSIQENRMDDRSWEHLKLMQLHAGGYTQSRSCSKWL